MDDVAGPRPAPGESGGPRPVAAPPTAVAARSGIPKWVKVLATVIIVGGGLGYLLYTTAAPEVEWYKHVDEVLAQPGAWNGKKLQLHGRVVKGTLLRRAAGTAYEYRFRVDYNGKNMEARYTGIVPDTFKDEAEVVLKGRVTPAGYFQVAPDGVMAKCPSKYDTKK
ncbi:MAG TPA: cytochrome c maturation protein CcmE [Polyangia bacterium]